MTASECFISVDMESDGEIPADYSMLQLGASVIYQPELTFAARGLKPISERYNREALAVTGLDRAWLLVHGTDPATTMGQFADWVVLVADGRKAVFVGNNAPYDWMFVCWYFHHFLGENPFGYNAIDARSYAMGSLGLRWADAALSRLPGVLALGPALTHDPLDDARQQGDCFARLVTERATRP